MHPRGTRGPRASGPRPSWGSLGGLGRCRKGLAGGRVRGRVISKVGAIGPWHPTRPGDEDTKKFFEILPTFVSTQERGVSERGPGTTGHPAQLAGLHNAVNACSPREPSRGAFAAGGGASAPPRLRLPWGRGSGSRREPGRRRAGTYGERSGGGSATDKPPRCVWKAGACVSALLSLADVLHAAERMARKRSLTWWCGRPVTTCQVSRGVVASVQAGEDSPAGAVRFCAEHGLTATNQVSAPADSSLTWPAVRRSSPGRQCAAAPPRGRSRRRIARRRARRSSTSSSTWTARWSSGWRRTAACPSSRPWSSCGAAPLTIKEIQRSAGMRQAMRASLNHTPPRAGPRGPIRSARRSTARTSGT
jgi:hypothetical protein